MTELTWRPKRVNIPPLVPPKSCGGAAQQSWCPRRLPRTAPPYCVCTVAREPPHHASYHRGDVTELKWRDKHAHIPSLVLLWPFGGAAQQSWCPRRLPHTAPPYCVCTVAREPPHHASYHRGDVTELTWRPKWVHIPSLVLLEPHGGAARQSWCPRRLPRSPSAAHGGSRGGATMAHHRALVTTNGPPLP